MATAKPAVETKEAVAFGTVPLGTETEDWRLMSAKIAFAFWSNATRLQLSALQVGAAGTWDEEATAFRAFIRFTLRAAEREGIKFRGVGDVSVLDESSDEWRLKTARLAWLFWLQWNRDTKRVALPDEGLVWKAESDAFREYVRDVVRQVQKIGIGIA